MANDNVYLKGLPEGTSRHVVETLLSQYGHVVNSKVFPPKGGNMDTVAVIQMGSVEEASMAISMLDGVSLAAKFSNKGRSNFERSAVKEEPDSFTAREEFGGQSGRPSFNPRAEPSSYSAGSHVDEFDRGHGGVSDHGYGDAGNLEANLYIKGLPLETTYDGLIDMFSPFGDVVSAKLLQPKAGSMHQDIIAMVRMGSLDQAQDAIDSLHDAPIAAPGDLPLKAKYHGDGITPSDNVFIKGLPLSTTDVLLREACFSFGDVISVKLLPKPGLDDLAALVRFGSVDEAASAIYGLEGQVLPNPDQKTLIVRFANNDRKANANNDKKAIASPPLPPRPPAAQSAPGQASHHHGSAVDGGARRQRYEPAPPSSTQPRRDRHSHGDQERRPRQRYEPPPSPSSRSRIAPAAAASAVPIKAKYHGDGHTPSDNIFLAGLPIDTTEESLMEECERFGSIDSIRLLHNKQGRNDLAALVRFTDVDMAANAILGLDGQVLSVPDQQQTGPSRYGPARGKLNFIGMKAAPY